MPSRAKAAEVEERKEAGKGKECRRAALLCSTRLFGQMIAAADGEQDKADTAATGPKNLLTLLPDEFTENDYIKVRQSQGLDTSSRTRIKSALNQWACRGYIARMESNDNIDKERANNDSDNYSSIFRKLKFKTNS